MLRRMETTGEIRARFERRAFDAVRLAAARNARGLKQREMAELIGRTLRQYQRIEAGEVDVPASLLIQLADVLSVTIDSLFAMPDEGAST